MLLYYTLWYVYLFSIAVPLSDFYRVPLFEHIRHNLTSYVYIY